MKIEDKNIDELLIAYLLKELDQEEIAYVEQWINTSLDNKSIYDEVEKVWSKTSMSNIDFDNKSGWKNVSNQINTKRIFLKPWMSIAASLIVLLSAYFIYQNKSQSSQLIADSGLNISLKPTVVIADVDQKKTTLIDESVIRINSNSKISYDSEFNKSKREVALVGEAFFDIKRNTSKPFIINTKDSKVEVLGTSFNINANPKDSIITVFVASGLVRFSYLPQDTTKEYQEIQLSAGKKVVYNKNSRKIQLFNDKAYNQTDTYWMDKKLSFEGVKLEKITKILEVIYDVKIVLFNKGLENCRITVGFENDGINQIMDVIASTFNIQVEHANDTYILKGSACEDN